MFAIEYDVTGVDDAHLVDVAGGRLEVPRRHAQGHGEPALPPGRRQARSLPVGPRLLRPPRDGRRRRRAHRLADEERGPAVPRDAGRRRPGALAHARRRREDRRRPGRRVYRSFDVLSPWTVGRFGDDAGADAYRATLAADLAAVTAAGKRYMPVVFPGFSWHNLDGGASNQIPRRGGAFYWRQVGNAVGAGATMLKTAMFDEVDEGTAMFKLAPTAAAAPDRRLVRAARRRRTRAVRPTSTCASAAPRRRCCAATCRCLPRCRRYWKVSDFSESSGSPLLHCRYAGKRDDRAAVPRLSSSRASTRPALRDSRLTSPRRARGAPGGARGLRLGRQGRRLSDREADRDSAGERRLVNRLVGSVCTAAVRSAERGPRGSSTSRLLPLEPPDDADHGRAAGRRARGAQIEWPSGESPSMSSVEDGAERRLHSRVVHPLRRSGQGFSPARSIPLAGWRSREPASPGRDHARSLASLRWTADASSGATSSRTTA